MQTSGSRARASARSRSLFLKSLVVSNFRTNFTASHGRLLRAQSMRGQKIRRTVSETDAACPVTIPPRRDTQTTGGLAAVDKHFQSALVITQVVQI